MARMVPFPMLPTESRAERRLYERFLEQLDDAYVCYHSVDWVMAGDRGANEGEADFVIAHPQHGVLVLEVKGGRLRYDPTTRRWTQTGKQGSHPSDDPFVQAKDAMHSLMEITRPHVRHAQPSFGFAVAFPDGEYTQPAHPGAPVEVVLDRRHLDALEDRVHEIMDHWRRPGRRFGSEGMDGLAMALGFRVEIRTPLALAFHEDDRKIIELTQDQAWLLAFITNRTRAAVTGPAGCGKTILAAQMARRMGEGGRRTLLTCFNKALAADLRARTEGVPNLDVHHFHELCWMLAREAGLTLPDENTADERTLFEHTLPGLLMDAAETLGPRYGAIVVDEAQDMREHWWPALLSVHEDPDDGPLYVFADDGQNLYGGALPLENLEHCPPLPHNLRNTKAIHRFVSVFHRGTDPGSARGPEGRPVEILGYADDEQLARTLGIVLKTLIEDEGVPIEDIVVLTPAGTAKSRLRSGGRAGDHVLSEDPAKGEVLATSVHAFKGLERPVVILAELGDRHEEDLDRYLYVGGSRARSHLFVLATEPVAERLRAIVRGAD